MPVQTTQSNVVAKFGARIAAANEACKDEPVDTGFVPLPAGIKNGIARLSIMQVEVQKADNAKTPKGEEYFRATAVVVFPEMHDRMKILNKQTSQFIPLCDVPATQFRAAEPFEANYAEMQNLIRSCGIAPCPETKATDPTGAKAWAYWMAAMKTLTDPQRPPTYIAFTTREWTPPQNPLQPNVAPKPRTIENWHGKTEWTGQAPNPAAGVAARGAAAGAMPGRMDAPPVSPDGLPVNGQAAVTQAVLPGITNAQIHGMAPGAAATVSAGPPDLDEVASLVDMAMQDPNQETEDGAFACKRLEELAWSNGWSREATSAAPDWAAVGGMALETPPAVVPPTATAPSAPAATAPARTVQVGDRFMFAKRNKAGEPLVDTKKQPFPPQEVQVTAVDAAHGTCTLKTTKDNKDIVDIRSKQPVAVKIEWLEPLR